MLLALVFKHYASGHNAELMHDINHLQQIRLRGENMESFQNSWTMVLSDLKDRLTQTSCKTFTSGMCNTSSLGLRTLPTKGG